MRKFRTHFTAIVFITIVLLVHFKSDPSYVTNRSYKKKQAQPSVQKNDQNIPEKHFGEVEVNQTLVDIVAHVSAASTPNWEESSNPQQPDHERELLKHGKFFSEPRIDFRKSGKDTGTGIKDLPKEIGSRKLWMRNFTRGIPADLTLLLQDVLERDFQKATAMNENFHRCKYGYFRLMNMEKCHKWLECDEITSLKSEKMIGSGGVKTITLAKWRGLHEVAIASVRKDRYMLQRYMTRARDGINNLLISQPSPYTTQVMGYCVHGNYTVLATEVCKYGDFRSFYLGPIFRGLPVLEKFKFAVQFVAQIDYLHRGLGLPRLHCDMHNVLKAFQQFLVSSDLRLFMNDLDDLPEVDKANNKLAGCKNEKQGVMSEPGFLAPEIRYTQEEYLNASHKKLVDEKSNIWKIPDITANIMMINETTMKNPVFFPIRETGFEYHLQDKLKPIHDRCKSIDPEKRPTSREVLIYYLKIHKELLLMQSIESE